MMKKKGFLKFLRLNKFRKMAGMGVEVTLQSLSTINKSNRSYNFLIESAPFVFYGSSLYSKCLIICTNNLYSYSVFMLLLTFSQLL